MPYGDVYGTVYGGNSKAVTIDERGRPMFTFPQGSQRHLPIQINDVNAEVETGLEGVTYDQVVVRLTKAGTVGAVKTLISADWVDAGLGLYWLRLSPTDTSAVGIAVVQITYADIPEIYYYQVDPIIWQV